MQGAASGEPKSTKLNVESRTNQEGDQLLILLILAESVAYAHQARRTSLCVLCPDLAIPNLTLYPVFIITDLRGLIPISTDDIVSRYSTRPDYSEIPGATLNSPLVFLD